MSAAGRERHICGDRVEAMIDLRLGDNREVLKTIETASIDAIVTDPPYELGFMGKSWDSTGIANSVDFWRLCLRVLKPGGHLVAFSSTRTSHRMVCAIEDAGFQVRDTLHWCTWSGFPKSLDISKSIDALHGAEREVVGSKLGHAGYLDITAPATEDAKRWAGYGSAVKPSVEPCVLARKPLAESSIARQVLATGTGALNLDACRFAPGDPMWPGPDDGELPSTHARGDTPGTSYELGAIEQNQTAGQLLGRYPANLIYCPKPSRAERDRGCEGLPPMAGHEAVDRAEGSAGLTPRAGAGGTAKAILNHHNTVKPIHLMRWLCRLVGGQKGSIILDPFMGSGTTGIAALAEGFSFVGIEQEEPYMRIAAARINHYATQPVDLPEGIELPTPEQVSLFGGK